jgi:hypothetical protein
VAEKLTVLWPIATVTLAGVVTRALLLLSDTTAAEIAAFVRAAVQVVEVFAPNAEGVQVSELS